MKLASQSGMKEYAAGIQSCELRLIDEPAEKKSASDAEAAASASAADNGTREPHNGSAQPKIATAPYNLDISPARVTSVSANASSESVAPSIDKFLTAATKEFEAGIIDQPLWKHAAAQSAGDRTAATKNYLRARATALRVAKREKRQERSARRERALSEFAHAPGGRHDAGAPTDAPTQLISVPRTRLAPNRAQVIWMGSGLAVAFCAALLLFMRSGGEAARHNEKSDLSPIASVAKTAKPAAPGAVPSKREAPEDWASKLEQLKTDGNWNVVVLYAGEWARAQPDNASAWKALAAGYVKLRQYRDALEAAGKVVRLSPDDAAAWQSLGQVNEALRQPADALAAFEQAVARNDRDGASMVQFGTLAMQLGRYADARAAFDKALSLNSADIDAMCGAATLAQKQQRAKDAETLLRQIAALDGRCRDVEGESVRVAIGEKTRPAISAR